MLVLLYQWQRCEFDLVVRRFDYPISGSLRSRSNAKDFDSVQTPLLFSFGLDYALHLVHSIRLYRSLLVHMSMRNAAFLVVRPHKQTSDPHRDPHLLGRALHANLLLHVSELERCLCVHR